MVFAKWLKQERTARGLSQEELAEQVSCAIATIRKLEAGIRQPSRQLALLVSRVFDVPDDEREDFVAFARSRHGDQYSSDNLAPWRKLRGTLANLPVPATLLLGREVELRALQDRLLSQRTRLLTITGPPGVGKTRLAIAASELPGTRERFTDGTFFVPLAPFTGEQEVLKAIASTVGIPLKSGIPVLAQLSSYLSGKRLLLVLDNFEQAMQAAASISSLLSAGPWLKVLVTSREELSVRGEWQFRLSPLAVPDEAFEPSRQPALASSLDLEALKQYPAIELFVQRACDVNRDFALSANNAQAVIDICRRIDGLPLALELVAAGCRLFSAQELLLQLDNGTLTGKLRDLPAHQGSLYQAVAWSYNMLSEAEKAVFRRFSVFVQGAAPTSATLVTSHSTEEIETRGDLFGQELQSLVSKSLLQHQTSLEGGAWLSMLETIRVFARRELSVHCEAENTAEVHAEYFTRFAEALESGLVGPAQKASFEKAKRNEHNLRSAIAWTLNHRRTDLMLRILGAMGRFWYWRGSVGEAEGWLQQAMDVLDEDSAPPSLLPYAKAIYWYGWTTCGSTELDKGEVRLRTVLDYAAELPESPDQKEAMALSCHMLGHVYRMRAQFGEARSFYNRAVALRQGSDKRTELAMTLYSLFLLDQDEAAASHRQLEEVVGLFRKAGNHYGMAFPLQGLAMLALNNNDMAQAKNEIEEALHIFEQWQNELEIGACNLLLGDIAQHEGRLEEANELYRKSFRLRWHSGNRAQTMENWERLGMIAALQGSFERAALLFGAAAELRTELRPAYDLFSRKRLPRLLEQTRSSLGEQEFESFWKIGATMDIEDVDSYALNQ